MIQLYETYKVFGLAMLESPVAIAIRSVGRRSAQAARGRQAAKGCK